MADDYERMRERAAMRWRTAQRIASRVLEFHADRISQMPDVMNRPTPDQEWTRRGMACDDCGKTLFRLIGRWVTINGVLHRCDAECVACHGRGVWDDGAQSWIIWKRPL